MALFRIFKGSSANLPAEMHDGYCYFTTDDGQFYIDYLEDPNDSTSLRRRPISGPGSSVEYIVGTQTTSTNVWTGVTKDPQLYTGKTIVYRLPYSNTTGNNATLTLTFTNPTSSATSGAKPVYYTGGTRAVNHYAAGSVILLTYDGSSWRRADYNANTNTFVTQEASTTDSWRKVLLHYTTNSAGGNVPSTVTNQVYAAQGIEVQPSTGTLAATKFKGPLEGNADTATAFSSAADVTLTGDVTGTVSSTKDWSIATTLAASGVTAGSYGPSTNATPGYGTTFDVPYITVDEKGRVTSASTKTVTIPTSDNTDTKVTQNAVDSTVNKDYRIILSYDANDTDAVTNTVNKHTNLRYNPSTNKLSTGNLQLTGTLTVTGQTTLNDNLNAQGVTATNLLVHGAANFVQSPTAPTPAKATNDTTIATTAFVKTVAGDYLPLAGGKMTGVLSWNDENALPAATSSEYFLAIDAFANGGSTKYITKANALKSLVGSSAIGSSTQPVYWNGSAFSSISSYSGDAALTGTPTAPTAAAGTNSTQIATTAFVTSAVQDLAGPMRFIGTLGSGGTITTLPAATESNKGHTYKVIAKGTYQGIYGEVGDLMISNGTAWINVPSGDVPDGTITNIATGSGLTGGPITTTGTISHADTSSQTSITADGRTYITGVTLDDFGHVTELSTGTETVTDTTYTISTGDGNGQIKVTPSSGSAYNVNVKGLGGQSITDGTAKYLAYYSDAHTISAAPQAHFNWSDLSGTTKGYEELVLGNKTDRFGRLALYGHDDASGGAYIVANEPTSWLTHTLPDQQGWIVTAGNGSTTGAGGARRPVYVSTSGIATAGAVTFDTLNANRLMWTNAADKVYAGYHYADSTHVAINSTVQPSYNFYVSGTVGFNIGTSDTTSSKKIVILGNNRYLSVGASGLQAYTGATSASTTGLLFLQYNGGDVQFGRSTSIESNITVHGNIMPGTTASYGLGSLTVGWRTLYLKGASGYSGIQYVMEADSSKAAAIVCLKDTSTTTIGQIGYHNTGDTNGAFYILPHNSVTGDAWNGKNGLYIGKNNLKWEDKYILRYSETATTGQVIISDNTSGNVKTSGFTIATSVPANAVFTDTTYTFNTTAQTNKVQYKVTGESNWTDIPINTVAVQIVRW